MHNFHYNLIWNWHYRYFSFFNKSETQPYFYFDHNSLIGMFYFRLLLVCEYIFLLGGNKVMVGEMNIQYLLFASLVGILEMFLFWALRYPMIIPQMDHLRLSVTKELSRVTSRVGQGAELKLRTVSRCEVTVCENLDLYTSKYSCLSSLKARS